MALLEVFGLSKSFGGLRAIDDLDFAVPSGMIKSVIGPNGAGKTTLFNLISGVFPPDAGRILFGSEHLEKIRLHEVARRGIARTYQHIRLFPRMTVLENVMIGRHRHGSSGFVAAMMRLPGVARETREERRRSLAILDLFGIADLAASEAVSLAYGKQRIVEVARALASEPLLLLLDEPAAGLNMRETEEMAAFVLKIKERGVTVLIVEHDMSLVMQISEEILVLSYGRKIADAPPAVIQKDTEVIRVYLGDDSA